ncbi:MAG: SUMF1/EgtB/PvdO family nonheme iron enzyme [Spirochaetales bacterium]
MAHRANFFILALLLTALPLAAQSEGPNPDALVADVESAGAALAKAQKAAAAELTQEGYETDEEFAARQAEATNLSGSLVELDYTNAVSALEAETFAVPAGKLKVTAAPFDKVAKAYTFTVTSSDPAVPFKGDVVYSIKDSQDLKGDFTKVEAAFKAKTLGANLTYQIVRRAPGYRVVGVAAEVGIDLASDAPETLWSVPFGNARWDFVAGKRAKPTAVGLVDLVRVEGGTFQMGSTDGEADEKPVHKVTLSAFSIGTTEVTQAQYQSLMGTNPSSFQGDDLPVETVSWFEAVAFCNKLSLAEGLTPFYTIKGTAVTTSAKATGYRLPTEAQWEFAARGGAKSQGSTYAGSSDLETVAWYGDNSDKTHSVATKAPNELGLFDLSGNVWEWCQDWYGAYLAKAQTDPAGAASGSNRVLRGGSWGNNASFATVSSRLYNYGGPGYQDGYIGFRVVRP